MPIEFRCHQCNKKLRVADAHAGKRAKCPNCQTVLNVPQPESAMEERDEFELDDPVSHPFDMPAAGKPAAASAGAGFDFSAGGAPPRKPQAAMPVAASNPFAATSAGTLAQAEMSDKSQKTAYLLSGLMLGAMGLDRFYTGRAGLGVAKLLTLGGCTIWAIIDHFTVGCGAMRDGQGRQLRREIVGTPTRSQATAYLLASFLGMLGADRFYLGQTGLGIAKLLTFGGFIVWWVIDLVSIGTGRMKDVDGNSLK